MNEAVLSIVLIQLSILFLTRMFQKGEACPLTVAIVITDIAIALQSIPPDIFIH